MASKHEGTYGTIKHKVRVFEKKKLYSVVIPIIVLIAFSMFMSAYHRSYSSTLPVVDEWAYNSIANNVANQISGSVSQQYPTLPADRRASLVQAELQTYLENNKEQIDEQVQLQAGMIRAELQNDEGQTYLLAIDPYYYWRQTRNVLEYGHSGDAIVDGKKWDTRMVAPIGRAAGEELHEYFSASVYNMVKVFNPDAKLFNVFFWMPLILAALSVIPAFFIAKKRAGLLGAYIAGIIVALHPVFMGRTSAGFADTDGYAIMFPLYIFWMFLLAFESKNWTHKSIYLAAMGLLMGLFSWAWGGWWYIFDFILAVVIVYLGYMLIRVGLREKDLGKMLRHKETRNTALTILGVIVASGVFVSIFSSFRTFILAPLSPLRITTIQSAAKTDLWPNVFTTVAELNRANLSTIVNNISSALPVMFFIAGLGIILTLTGEKKLVKKDWAILGGGALLLLLLINQRILLETNPLTYLALLVLPVAVGLVLLLKDKRDIDVKYAIFLSVWFLGTVYASTQGIRFILLLVPAYAVAMGIAIGATHRLIVEWAKSEKREDWVKWGISAVFVLVAIIMSSWLVSDAQSVGKSQVPSMNDAWWSSLVGIDQEASPDAIITSWWDFGHWFKSIANRPVTFDGASQNTPMAHWVGRALATSNEDEAVGIMRMLDCGSRTGFETLAMRIEGVGTVQNISPETTLQVRALFDDLLVLDKGEAENYLLGRGIPQGVVDEVLPLTHCEPPQKILITSGDMVNKAGVWAHFGLWDFERAYIYSVLRRQAQPTAVARIQELMGKSAQEASALYTQAVTQPNEQAANAWISPWPGYTNTRLTNCVKEENSSMVRCAMSLNIGRDQGQTIRIEQLNFNMSNPSRSSFSIGAYQEGSGMRLGGQEGLVPKGIVIADSEMRRYETNQTAALEYDMLLWNNNERYYALLAAPELSMSMFTRLFFLEGQYTTRFEKFSDKSSFINGDRIIVWTVDY